MSGKLFVVATPIGNAGDLSPRARETLAGADTILAEDTRVTLRLLRILGIPPKRLVSYSEYSSPRKEEIILANLRRGENYALVSDAGTPGLSDPGSKLVGEAVLAGISVLPVPGPSAIAALASVFGEPFAALHFWGFFPRKPKKQAELARLFREIDGLHVFFESPFRVVKTFEERLVPLEGFRAVACREMTKTYETYLHGTPAEVLKQIRGGPVKGEFTVGLKKTKPARTTPTSTSSARS